MTQKPIIGILPLYDPQKNSYWMLPQYLEAIQACGGLPLILPPRLDEEEMAQILNLCQGFLFPGGQAIEPARYGMERSAWCAPSLPQRDLLEFSLFHRAYQMEKPMLGICRGLQLFNTALGGTLYQHLPAELPGALDHDMTKPYDRVVHTVRLEEGTPLRQLAGQEVIGVNSYHHQAVHKLAPGLLPMAWAPDGVLEAAYAPDRQFLWGIQWHPEYLWRWAEHGGIFQMFVDSCRTTQVKVLLHSAVPG